ncbi:metal-sulfur cluster assembly factor [Ancylobacter terrae]|uniref:metal-sulfur cluster assembly factor n=1 Tax=Ancylobacter sp. sgz301288 TaxID=3342077 RepID=UPI00385F938F
MSRPHASHRSGRRIDEVWERLAEVMDPELDESIVDLGFVEDVAIDPEGGVDVGFRLPTYWCSPNFAFLMADDIGRELRALPWVRAARPRLEDHLCAAEVNRGAQLGLGFAEAFRDYEVDGSLEELRETFQRKAFQRRQEAVLLALRRAGWSDERLVAMDLATFDRLVIAEPEGARQKPRYRALLLERWLAAKPDDRAFVTLDGEPIAAEALPAHLRTLRAVRINMEASGALCRDLAGARYRETPGERSGACGGGGAGCGGCSLGAPGAAPLRTTAAPA